MLDEAGLECAFDDDIRIRHRGRGITALHQAGGQDIARAVLVQLHGLRIARLRHANHRRQPVPQVTGKLFRSNCQATSRLENHRGHRLALEARDAAGEDRLVDERPDRAEPCCRPGTSSAVTTRTTPE